MIESNPSTAMKAATLSGENPIICKTEQRDQPQTANTTEVAAQCNVGIRTISGQTGAARLEQRNPNWRYFIRLEKEIQFFLVII